MLRQMISAAVLITLSLFVFGSCAAEEAPVAEKEDTGKMEVVNASTTEFTVSGMTCDGCVNAIEKALNERDGVVDCKVSLETNIATVRYDAEKVSSDELKAVVTKTGYGVENMP